MINTITCPKCKSEIPVNDLVDHDLKEMARIAVEKDHLKKLEEVKRDSDLKYSDELNFLKKQNEEKDLKMVEFRQKEMDICKEKNKLEEEREEMDLIVQRRVDNEKRKTEEITAKRVSEDYSLKLLEKDQHIENMAKKIEELQRKSVLTSQQIQGEALELYVQRELTKAFPDDEIVEVEKFKNGSDIKETVKSKKGVVSGIIIWECKRVNIFKPDYIKKLKEDILRDEADYGIIVSTTLPKEAIYGLARIDSNVWLCSRDFVGVIAIALRESLINVAREKWLALHNKDGRGDKLISYFTSAQYSQQIREQAEVLKAMREQIDKEKTAYTKIWSDRENQITRQIASIAKVLSTIGGHVGSSMPQIEGFDLLSLEEGEA